MDPGGKGKGRGNSVKVSLDTLQDHTRQLFQTSGEKARLVLKFRQCDSRVSIRVTDDKQTAKFKTNRGSDLNKVKALVGYVVTGKEQKGMAADPSSPLRTAGRGKNKRSKKG